MMSTTDHVAIGVEKLNIDSGSSLEKEFIVLIMTYESLATGYLKYHILNILWIP